MEAKFRVISQLYKLNIPFILSTFLQQNVLVFHSAIL
uniref:Uncharacterized protein n=1 Tax=Anguilla anguilla TaxID=7936 RepID=A0A0E9WGN8_ANGAN